jgi:Rrf2 family protein
MNLSKRSEYAIRAMVDVAIAAARGRRVVSLAALAQAQRIPAAFLEQILLSLRQGNFLTSTRGKLGGYSLSRAAAQIGMGELLEFLDGPLVSAACVSGAVPTCVCPDPERCSLRWMMERMRHALSGVIEELTLAVLAERTLEVFERDGLVPPVLREAHGEGTRGKPRVSGSGQSEPEYWI